MRRLLAAAALISCIASPPKKPPEKRLTDESFTEYNRMRIDRMGTPAQRCAEARRLLKAILNDEMPWTWEYAGFFDEAVDQCTEAEKERIEKLEETVAILRQGYRMLVAGEVPVPFVCGVPAPGQVRGAKPFIWEMKEERGGRRERTTWLFLHKPEKTLLETRCSIAGKLDGELRRDLSITLKSLQDDRVSEAWYIGNRRVGDLLYMRMPGDISHTYNYRRGLPPYDFDFEFLSGPCSVRDIERLFDHSVCPETVQVQELPVNVLDRRSCVDDVSNVAISQQCGDVPALATIDDSCNEQSGFEGTLMTNIPKDRKGDWYQVTCDVADSYRRMYIFQYRGLEMLDRWDLFTDGDGVNVTHDSRGYSCRDSAVLELMRKLCQPKK